MPRINQQYANPFLPVSKMPLFTSDGEKSSRQSVMLQTEEGQVEVGNVSESYQLVPNETVHEIALDVLSRSELSFEDAGMIFDGKRYRQRWILPELLAEPRKGDIVQLALDIVNSYDGSTTFGLAFNAQRLVCENGMMVDFMLGGFRFRHFGHDDFGSELEMASSHVRGLVDKLTPLSSKLQRLIDTTIDRESIQAVFKVLALPQSLQAQIFMQIDEYTLRGLYNAFTGVLTGNNTHRAESINRQVSRFILAGSHET
jgi:hypothetical protein